MKFKNILRKKIVMFSIVSAVLLFIVYSNPWITAAIVGDYLTILVLVMLLAPLIYRGRKK